MDLYGDLKVSKFFSMFIRISRGPRVSYGFYRHGAQNGWRAGACLRKLSVRSRKPWYCSWVTDIARPTGSARSPGRCSGGRRSAGGRVQAICDYVHQHIAFGYEHARASRTAWETFCDRTGVCRDYTHLAVALCRSMTIPARYCTGYLGDIGAPATDAPMVSQPGSKPISVATGTVRRAQQHPAHRLGADRPRSRWRRTSRSAGVLVRTRSAASRYGPKKSQREIDSPGSVLRYRSCAFAAGAGALPPTIGGLSIPYATMPINKRIGITIGGTRYFFMASSF
jgi:hypothetical protein